MSISVKQLAKALSEASGQGSQKKTKSKAKRKRANKQSTQNPAMIPGTAVARPVTSSRSVEWALSHREYLGQFIVPKNTSSVQGAFVLMPFSFPWLGNLSKNFEKYQWTRLTLDFVPDVGTTKDGSIAMGIDWGVQTKKVWATDVFGRPALLSDSDYTRAGVLAMTPSLVTPVWRPAQISLPKNLLQSRKWYDVLGAAATAENLNDAAPGSVAYFVNASAATDKDLVLGDVWATYRVVFAGTKA